MIEIRAATSDDVPAIVDVYAPYVENTTISFETEVPTVEDFAARMNPKFPWLVAVDGEVAGYAYAGPHRARAAYRWCTETSVYVSSQHHRKGVGRLLYQHLLDELRARDFVNAYAGITQPNPASVAFHESLGFELIGVYEKIGFKHGAWHDVAWYGLRLSNL